MDGDFKYKDRRIDFKITDNKGIIVRNGVEKMSRFITFYLENENLGTYAIYGDAEQMCNISFEDAQKEFENHILQGNLDKSKIL